MQAGSGITSSAHARTGLKILIVAGEVSGDQEAGLLSRELLRLSPDLHLFGAGGEQMVKAGVDVRVSDVHLGCVGITESLRLLLPVRKLFLQLSQLIEDDRPDLAILVDNEGFNGRMARILVELGIPLVFYFPPQVWMWGRYRATRVARLADLVLPAFQQEAEIYTQAGARVQWSGHPMLDSLEGPCATDWECREAGLDPHEPMLALFPGSRVHELKRLTPILLDAAKKVREVYPRMQFVVPVAAAVWEPMLKRMIRSSGLNGIVMVPGPAYSILRRCSAAIVKSGTASLEIALLGVPNVVTYRIGRLSFLVARLVARTRFIAMANILADRQIVREFVQSQANPENLAAEALRILSDTEYAETMRCNLARVRDRLGRPGAARRSAQFILEVLHERTGVSAQEALCVG